MSIVKLNNRALKDVTSIGSASSGSINFIKKLTASSSANLSFVHGSSSVVLDSTYKTYMFIFTDLHYNNDAYRLRINASIDSGSNYNVTKTTTFFYGYNRGSDGANFFGYNTNRDLAQSTDAQPLTFESNIDNYSSSAGILYLFNPSSTTFVKNFLAVSNDDAQTSGEQGLIQQCHVAGYFNTTSAINAIRFDNDGGNIDAGNIILYGIN